MKRKVAIVIRVVLVLFVIAAVSFIMWRKNTQSWDEPAFDIDKSQVKSGAELKQERVAEGGESSEIPGVEPAEHHLVAYYFMNDVRCPSCVKIETWTHDAIAAAFADELANGELVWKMVNTDRSEHRHFIEEYEIVTKQVILSEINAGAEDEWVNLGEIWSLLGDEEQFKTYVVTEVRAQLDWLEQS